MFCLKLENYKLRWCITVKYTEFVFVERFNNRLKLCLVSLQNFFTIFLVFSFILAVMHDTVGTDIKV